MGLACSCLKAKKSLKHKNYLLKSEEEKKKKKVFGYIRSYESEINAHTLKKQFVKRKEITRWSYQESQYEFISAKQLGKGIKLSKKMLKLKLQYTKSLETQRYRNNFIFLNQALRRLRSLESLDFCFKDFPDQNIPNQAILFNFFEPLNKLVSLQNLKISFPQKIKERFTRPSIIFKDPKPKDTQVLFYFQSRLKTLNLLKRLTLEFQQCWKIPVQTLKILTMYFKRRYSHLESLHLDFRSCPKATIHEVLQLLETLKKARSLKNLVLRLGRLAFFYDNILSKLLESLTAFGFLNSIGLGFNGGETKNFGVGNLLQHFAQTANLHEISFPLDFTQLSNKMEHIGLLKILESLADFNLLRSLGVNFYGVNNSQNGILENLTQVVRHPKLQDLLLDFHYCHGLDNSNLDTLFKGLKHVASLKNLTIIFPEYSSIAELNFQHINEFLSTVTSLKTLTFLFDRSEKENIILNAFSLFDSLQKQFPAIIFSTRRLENY